MDSNAEEEFPEGTLLWLLQGSEAVHVRAALPPGQRFCLLNVSFSHPPFPLFGTAHP